MASKVSKIDWKDMAQGGDNRGNIYGIRYILSDGTAYDEWWYKDYLRENEFKRAQESEAKSDDPLWADKYVEKIKRLLWLRDPQHALPSDIPADYKSPKVPAYKPAPAPVVEKEEEPQFGGDYADAINKVMGEGA